MDLEAVDVELAADELAAEIELAPEVVVGGTSMLGVSMVRAQLTSAGSVL